MHIFCAQQLVGRLRWAPEVSLPLPYQRSAKVFLIFLRQAVKTMYYFKNMHSKSLKCAKYRIELDI